MRSLVIDSVRLTAEDAAADLAHLALDHASGEVIWAK